MQGVVRDCHVQSTLPVDSSEIKKNEGKRNGKEKQKNREEEFKKRKILEILYSLPTSTVMSIIFCSRSTPLF
jgi:hypothetical protein